MPLSDSEKREFLEEIVNRIGFNGSLVSVELSVYIRKWVESFPEHESSQRLEKLREDINFLYDTGYLKQDHFQFLEQIVVDAISQRSTNR